MPAFRDITGKTFGRLKVLSRAPHRRGQKSRWFCICECGTKNDFDGSHLISGNTKSCGCLQREMISQRSKTHGKTNTQEFTAWVNIRARCSNNNSSGYKNYGGRGIKVCDRWLNSFERFYADMGPKPSPELTIERIDNDGNYEPMNCRWATRTEQVLNQRLSKKNISGVSGVTWKKRDKRWVVNIGVNHKYIWIGQFRSLGDAVKARFDAETKYWEFL